MGNKIYYETANILNFPRMILQEHIVVQYLLMQLEVI